MYKSPPKIVSYDLRPISPPPPQMRGGVGLKIETTRSIASLHLFIDKRNIFIDKRNIFNAKTHIIYLCRSRAAQHFALKYSCLRVFGFDPKKSSVFENFILAGLQYIS